MNKHEAQKSFHIKLQEINLKPTIVSIQYMVINKLQPA
jgi:hypothetical protein